MLEFVNTLVDDFAVHPWGTHVGVISFDETARVAFPFNALKGYRMNAHEVKRLISQTPHRQGDTRIDHALQLASSYLFTSVAGARPDALKVTVSPAGEGGTPQNFGWGCAARFSKP